MGLLKNTALALGTLTVVAAAPSAERPATVPSGFAVRYGNVISTDRVRSLVVLPGERVTLEVVGSDSGLSYLAHSQAGLLIPVSPGRWNWTAPREPGLYPIQLVARDTGDSVSLRAFVAVPFDRLEDEHLNGYRIGRYPSKPPAGFVEVTKENEDVFVSPHFRLKQFLCKQPAGSRKYVVLNERLLLALEYVLERVNAAGHRATTFHVMSGYRTPAYNRSLANVGNSQHQWGAAADIFIDENGDGRMDDLTGDGRSDIRDAELLYRLIDDAAARTEGQGLIGGLGKYPPTAAHGPFVHVDVRDRKARW